MGGSVAETRHRTRVLDLPRRRICSVARFRGLDLGTLSYLACQVYRSSAVFLISSARTAAQYRSTFSPSSSSLNTSGVVASATLPARGQISIGSPCSSSKSTVTWCQVFRSCGYLNDLPRVTRSRGEPPRNGTSGPIVRSEGLTPPAQRCLPSRDSGPRTWGQYFVLADT